MRTVPSGWAFWTFQGLVTDSLGASCHLPTYQRGNQGPEMGRGSPSVTQRLVQAGGAQVWRAGALHSMCLQDGKEDAQLSAGRAGLVSPGQVQGLAPLGQDGFEQPEQADLLGQPWATRRRPLRVDVPSPAGLTALSLIRPRSAASGALVGPGSGASCRPALLRLCRVRDPGGQAQAGPSWLLHTQAGGRRERMGSCVSSPATSRPRDTAERPVPWWP